MIRSTPMYVTRVQREKGVLTLRTMRKYPPPIKLYRQDHSAKEAAAKIQTAWRDFRLWKFSYNPVYPKIIVDETLGAFSHMHGYYPNLCATKLQAVFRGHKARQRVPMMRMTEWILKNLLL